MRDIARRRAQWTILMVMTFALAACAGGSKSSGRTVAPGYGSPEAAVAGFFTGIAQNQSSITCSYVDPSGQAACPDALNSTAVSVGHWSIGKSFVLGDQALVVVVADKYCVALQCGSNSNPSKDLPHDNADFARAYTASADSGVSNPTVQCIQVNGQWYVNFLR
jgi:hypothetical protein